MKNNFKAFFEQLSEKDRARLAQKAGTTVEYIEHHLLDGRRMPRRGLLLQLVAAARELGGNFTPEQIVSVLLDAQTRRELSSL